jgi:DNA polymerase
MRAFLQHEVLFDEINKLHHRYGCPNLSPIYGAGCIHKPDLMLLFMNPTGRNVSANPNWSGLKAPWLGTKNIWKICHELGLITNDQYAFIRKAKTQDWTFEFGEQLYQTISDNKVYITNLAKCTQINARKLSDKVFKAYLKNTKKEIGLVKPKWIVTFGTQISSILLGKRVRINDYLGSSETLEIEGKLYQVFPVYYPVGQGTRNMAKAITRVKNLMRLS